MASGTLELSVVGEFAEDTRVPGQVQDILPVEESEVVPLVGPPKRRRLWRKTPDTGCGVESSLAPDVVAREIERGSVLLPRDLPLERKRFLSKYSYWWRSKEHYQGLTRVEATEMSRRYNLRALPPETLADRLQEFRQAHPEETASIEAWQKEHAAHHHAGCTPRREFLFLTWNGEWGVLRPGSTASGTCYAQSSSDQQPSSAPARGDECVASPAAAEIPNDCCPPSRVDPEYQEKQCKKLALRVRHEPRVVEIVSELQRLLDWLVSQKGVSMFAWAVELCTRTFASDGSIRCHAHAFVKFQRRETRWASDFQIMLSTPHISDSLGSVAFGRYRNMAVGFYYLQSPKISTLIQGGSHQPFVDYGVTAAMVLSLVQGGKMLYDDARRELSKIPVGIVKNLESLDRWHRERGVQKQEALLAWHRQQLAKEQQPWRRFPLVEVWLDQYRRPQPRFKFLVLDGPTRVGKTLFARALCREGEVLELNMAGGAMVDLRDYDVIKHELLLFDECTPAQVLQHKKLFQAGPSMIQMGTSMTNVYAFQVYVAGKKFVVSSNVWSQELRRQTVPDLEWLQENSILVYSDRPMWVEHTSDLLPLKDKV